MERVSARALGAREEIGDVRKAASDQGQGPRSKVQGPRSKVQSRGSRACNPDFGRWTRDFPGRDTLFQREKFEEWAGGKRLAGGSGHVLRSRARSKRCLSSAGRTGRDRNGPSLTFRVSEGEAAPRSVGRDMGRDMLFHREKPWVNRASRWPEQRDGTRTIESKVQSPASKVTEERRSGRARYFHGGLGHNFLLNKVTHELVTHPRPGSQVTGRAMMF